MKIGKFVVDNVLTSLRICVVPGADNEEVMHIDTLNITSNNDRMFDRTLNTRFSAF